MFHTYFSIAYIYDKKMSRPVKYSTILFKQLLVIGLLGLIIKMTDMVFIFLFILNILKLL